MASLYEILKVSSNATLKEITAGYRQQSLFWHPDKNPACNGEFLILKKAYDILRDDEKRALYDLFGTKIIKYIEDETKYKFILAFFDIAGRKILLIAFTFFVLNTLIFPALVYCYEKKHVIKRIIFTFVGYFISLFIILFYLKRVYSRATLLVEEDKIGIVQFITTCLFIITVLWMVQIALLLLKVDVFKKRKWIHLMPHTILGIINIMVNYTNIRLSSPLENDKKIVSQGFKMFEAFLITILVYVNEYKISFPFKPYIVIFFMVETLFSFMPTLLINLAALIFTYSMLTGCINVWLKKRNVWLYGFYIIPNLMIMAAIIVYMKNPDYLIPGWTPSLPFLKNK